MPSVLTYRVSVADAAAHLFDVELTLAGDVAAGQRLTLPAWIPGSYMIRDFARNIVSIRAEGPAAALPLRKLDKQTWAFDDPAADVRVRYHVYAWDLSVRSAYLDRSRAYFNGTSLFLRVSGCEQLPHEVIITRPAGAGFTDWRVATTLPAVDVDRDGFGHRRADNYEALIDYPVEVTAHTPIAFQAADVPHEMVIAGRHDCDRARLADDLTRICNQHVAMFGELPVSHYLFITMATGDGYGGLEHRDSTSLMCARDDLPRPGMDKPDEGYRRFLGLCSHEYFHLWNVKRIRPEVLKQADLSAEAHTELLWAFEGFTSYYDELALVRAGCIDRISYLELLAQTVTRVLRCAGRHTQSVAESSFDAWTKFYKQDENAPNAIVSYYTKGALVAFGLDMTLRDVSSDSVTLDDLLRALWQHHGKPDVGVPEDGILTLANALSGADLSDFFARYVHGTDELPLADWLGRVGVGVQQRPAADPADQGKACEDPPAPAQAKPTLGGRWVADNGAAKLTHVFTGGAAHAAGLSAGDRLLAVDGIQALPDKLATRIAKLPVGTQVDVHAFRRDELMTFTLTAQPAPADTVTLWPLADAQLSDAQRRRRDAWLASVV